MPYFDNCLVLYFSEVLYWWVKERLEKCKIVEY